MSSTEKSTDLTIECRDEADVKSGCQPGRVILYYAEPGNGAELTAADSPDPGACRDKTGYSGSQVPIRQSTHYCMRTNYTYAVFRISSAPTTRPAGQSDVIVVEVEVATTSRN